LVDVNEAADRLVELIELALRGDKVLICRAGKPVAELIAVAKNTAAMDEVWALADEGRSNVLAGATYNHDDEQGLPI
jgi:antitoxin (DNA-binding transcriptional repressor) of toxin-antitoxin stability system